MAVKLQAVIPKRLFKLRTVREEMFKEMKRQMKIIDNMYGATYRTWNHKPQFRTRFRSGSTTLEGIVSTIDVIYFWVDDGTKRHPILSRRSRVLAFPSRSTPKTTPRIIGSRQGSRSGQAFATHVVHPGTKPRNFTKEIVKRRQGFYTKQMQRAIKRGVIRVA